MSMFVDGDSTAFAELWASEEDVTVLGAFGGYERGWSAVQPRLSWAASQFRQGRWTYEPLSAHFGTDVGYTVGIEHTEASIGGRDRRQDLRVTHVFRHVGGSWRIVHRHADGLVDRTDPASS